MTSPLRIALIHATRVAIDPIETAAAQMWPDAELVSLLDEALSVDRATNRVPDEELDARIVDLARYAERLDPAGILYTCSAFGPGIEQAAASSKLPVLKPNEAMFEAALTQGTKIAMIYTFAPAARMMEREFIDATEQIGSNAKLQSLFADGAREALSRGDNDTHNHIVAQTAAGVKDADVILLAHFSTAQAAVAVRKMTSTPVLTSPESAIEKMQRLLEISSARD